MIKITKELFQRILEHKLKTDQQKELEELNRKLKEDQQNNQLYNTRVI